MVFRFSSLEGVTEKPLNNFKNDGSFLETFKKLQTSKAQQQKQAEEDTTSGPSTHKETPQSEAATPGPSVTKPTKPTPPVIGKRRGGRVLPTGKVKKIKTEEEVEETPKDAWSQYLREVKKYRETTCQEEDNKTRPLVK